MMFVSFNSKMIDATKWSNKYNYFSSGAPEFTIGF